MTRRSTRRRRTGGGRAAAPAGDAAVVGRRTQLPAHPRRDVRSRRADSGGRLGLAVVGLVGAVVLVALLIRGFAGSNPTASGGTAASTLRPPAGTGVSGTVGGAVAVDGEALAPFGDGADAAIGRPMPALRGTTLAGAPLAIPSGDGRARVLIFLAHWCGHCQAEVPRVQAWIDAGSAPSNVDLYAVSTSADPSRPEYPPAVWLARERWSVPTIADDGAGTLARAAGLGAFPYFVFVHADGTVARRTVGQLSIAELETILGTLRR